MTKPQHHILGICISTLFICTLLLVSSPVFSIASSASTNLAIATADADYKKGYRYETGNKAKKDLSKAIYWYKKAANKSHKKAQYRLGILYYKQKNYKKAKYWLEKRATAGEPDAQYHYANILRFGLGFKQQTSTARKWYLKAAKQGHRNAQYELGLMYKKGIGARKNLIRAEKWFKKAAKQNHKHAKQALGTLANKKQTPHKTKQTAQQRFLAKNTKLANAGDAEAQYKLGKAYKTGKHAPINHKKAFKWLKEAANANHASAQYQLANIYYDGSKATKKNTSKAKQWYSKAADNGHKQANKALDAIAKLNLKQQQNQQFDDMMTSAMLGEPEQQYELGMRYLIGFKTEPDEQQAHFWFTLAADQKHAEAMYQLGNQYLKGEVVEKNTNTALHFFTAAAKQKVKAAQTVINLFSENGFKERIDAENGDKVAQMAIAQSYLNKLNPSVQRVGLVWLRKSAAQSHTPALISLAQIYEDGNIAPRNLAKAFTAYKSAANLNDATAQYRVGRMYQSGIGIELNQKLAFRWFEKAASQGLREAEQALQFSGL